MLFYRYNLRLNLIVLALSLIVCGCSTLGPTTISRGRADYNEAINRTDDEQLLLALVRGRYGETSRLLAVTGVTANVRFAANAGTEVSVGREEFHEWTFVPFRGGLAYEENPTITYAPVQGEQYLRQIMSPIPLDLLVLAVRSSRNSAGLFTLLATRVNGIRNPGFLHPPAKPDSRFSHLVLLLQELSDEGILHWVKDKREGIEFNVVIREYAPTHSDRVVELLNLLGLPVPEDNSEDIVIPIYFALERKELKGIALTTRSVLDLIEILRASVEVPDDHVRSGLAAHYPPPGLAGKDVHIRMSKEIPKSASVAVKYGEGWFYIENTDQHTKMAFRTLRTLWDVVIANAVGQQPAPVLTLPVSR